MIALALPLLVVVGIVAIIVSIFKKISGNSRQFNFRDENA